MAHPHLTEYLLVLATDSTKLTQYNDSDKNQRDALGKAAGLTTEQSDALESADSTRIMTEVLAELNKDVSKKPQPAYTIQLKLELQPCKNNSG